MWLREESLWPGMILKKNGIQSAILFRCSEVSESHIVAICKMEQLQVDTHSLLNYQNLFYTFPPSSSRLSSVLSIVKSDSCSEPDYGGVSVSTGEPGLERSRAGVLCSRSVRPRHILHCCRCPPCRDWLLLFVPQMCKLRQYSNRQKP